MSYHYEPEWRRKGYRRQAEPDFTEPVGTAVTRALREIQQKQEREVIYYLGLAASAGKGLRVRLGPYETNFDGDPYTYSIYQTMKFELAHDLSPGEIVVEEEVRHEYR